MITEAAFIEMVTREFADTIDAEIHPESRILDDLGMDSLELLRLMLLAESLVPGFELPPQLDLKDVAIRDIHHYLLQYQS